MEPNSPFGYSGWELGITVGYSPNQLSKRSLWSLRSMNCGFRCDRNDRYDRWNRTEVYKAGFHMIATIITLTWKPSHGNQCYLSDRCHNDRCDRYDRWKVHSFFYIRTSIFLAEAEPKPNVLIFLAIWAWNVLTFLYSISVNHSSEWKKEQIGQVLPISSKLYVFRVFALLKF